MDEQLPHSAVCNLPSLLAQEPQRPPMRSSAVCAHSRCRCCWSGSLLPMPTVPKCEALVCARRPTLLLQRRPLPPGRPAQALNRCGGCGARGRPRSTARWWPGAWCWPRWAPPRAGRWLLTCASALPCPVPVRAYMLCDMGLALTRQGCCG